MQHRLSDRLVRRAFVVAALAACGRDGAELSPNASPALPKTTVEASRADAIMMVRNPNAPPGARGGTTLQLDAAARNPKGRELENKKHIDWRTSDSTVASVDSTGLVTAQGVGSASIYVEHKKSADTVAIDVIPVPVRAVLLAGADSMGLDDTVRFAATPVDSDGVALEGRAVSWSSSVPAVASVSELGDVIALSPDTTTIGATVDAVTGTKQLLVTKQPVATITIEPASVTLPQFRKQRYFAVTKDRRGKVLVDRPVAWSSTNETIASFKASTDTVVARDVGAAAIVATAELRRAESPVTVTNPIEARSLWVTRFEYTGPSAVDFARIATIFQKAASANFNVVYFQVRTSGDALYYSDLEPCSPRMCGSLGGPRPSQDPLAVALREAAKYGIEVHAWLNAYTGFISGSSTACNQFINSTPPNWLKAHPEWSVSTKNFSTGVITPQVNNCLGTSEYMWVSPGVPQVRTQLARVAADIARRYRPSGLRGIHLDRVRFPSNQVSYDGESQEAFRAATGSYPASNAQSTWLDFRRGFVSQGVKEVFDSIRAVDPALVLSAAVFPGYRPRAGWSALWSYTDLFQDPQAWAQGGYLDVEVPMNYPATAASTSWTVKAYCSNTDWTCVLDDHMQRIERTAGRHVYVGVGAIKGWDEIAKQIDLARDRLATGVSVYSFSLVDAIPNGWTRLATGAFRHRATIPAMPWKP